MKATATVQDLLEPVLTADGVELVDVELAAGVLRVFVDRPGGIDLDAVSSVSQRVSEVLDEHDPVPGRYTLEVSSPGLERPLRRPEHFHRFVGTTVAIKTKAGTEGERRVQARLDGADDVGVEIAGRRIRYDDIERAHTVFEWGTEPKGKARTP